jgi:hypothetical protein
LKETLTRRTPGFQIDVADHEVALAALFEIFIAAAPNSEELLVERIARHEGVGPFPSLLG